MLRRTNVPQVYFAHSKTMFNGLEICKNAIVWHDGTGDVYVCNNMPRNYKGENPKLTVSVWDDTFKYWEHNITMQSYATRMMYKAYMQGGYKRVIHEERIDFSNDAAIRKFKGHGLADKPRWKNHGEIQLDSGECIIARTFNTGNMLSYNSATM